jgi:SagB-type dehydrogenase family enzyme
MTETEISPFHKDDIDCSTITTTQEPRLSSLAIFNDQPLDFSQVQQLLVNAFAEHQGTRPYPSAGGLYCVEPLVFLFEERLNDFKHRRSGCYHFRAVTKQLQLITPLDITHFYDKLLHGFMKNNHLPAVGIMYIVNISKAIFKYRYRGYRHALMEVGSMYQQASVSAQALGLRNTVWSTFSDQEMLYALNLDHGAYLPMTMQFFGYSES